MSDVVFASGNTYTVIVSSNTGTIVEPAAKEYTVVQTFQGLQGPAGPNGSTSSANTGWITFSNNIISTSNTTADIELRNDAGGNFISASYFQLQYNPNAQVSGYYSNNSNWLYVDTSGTSIENINATGSLISGFYVFDDGIHISTNSHVWEFNSNSTLAFPDGTLQNTAFNTTYASNAYSNAVSYVDGKSFVNTSQLSSNLSNYSLLSGATFTGNVVANNANTTYDLNVGRNLMVTGNLTVTGNVTVIGANNLSIVDNMIYLNSNSTSTNPDLGFAGNYNDGTYHHAGFFRDHSSGTWKVFDNYAPEPDANVWIDQTNTTFHIANFQANVVYVGNTSVYSTVNTTNFTGTSNNTLYVGSVTADNVVSNAQLSGNLSSYQTTSGLSANVAKLTSNLANYIIANTGLVSNATGVYVNTTYISTLSSNNSSYLGGVAAASYLVTNTAINTGNVSVTGNITLTGNVSGNTAGFAIGYRDIPQNFTNTSFSLALTDAGKHILTQNSGSSTQTITVPNNSSVAFSTGAAISIIVQSTGTVALANGAGVTMYLAGNSTAKSTITLNTYSMATVMKIGTDTWIVSGTGAT